MHYVYSTLSCSNVYTLYGNDDKPNEIGKIVGQVEIKGGANLVDKHFVTPKGIVTKVTDEQLEMLEMNVNFQNHKKLGFISVEKVKDDPENVAKDMAERDKSAPLTDEIIESEEFIKGELKAHSDDAPKPKRSRKGKK